MAIYVDYEDIKGEVTQDGFKDQIEVLSVSWGVGRGISMTPGATGNRESTEPSVSEISIVKQFDAASTKLFTEACTGSKGKTVKINLVSTGNPGAKYVVYTLTDALISSYSVSSSGDRPTESISISFVKLEFEFIPMDKDGKPKSSIKVAYDLSTAKTS